MGSLIELIAEKQHEIWAHWMSYLFEVSEILPNGSCHIPSEYVQRWLGQMQTPYDQLTDSEKKSDREQAKKLLTVLNPYLHEDC